MVGPICVSVGLCLTIVLITFALHIFWLEPGSWVILAMHAYEVLVRLCLGDIGVANASQRWHSTATEA